MGEAIAKLGDAWKNGEGVTYEVSAESEVYSVRDKVWAAAGMESRGGCLCIACLEKRLGRQLKPKDFKKGHPFNMPDMPGTPRLLQRRGKPKG